MALAPGTLLNSRYRIIEILGQGGMGAVYRAMDVNIGVEVALKENLFTTDDYARQFHREALILANIKHPNITRVTDHFIVDGQGQYLVMEFIEGEDLRQKMDRQGIISEEEAITIGSAICDALVFLEARAIPVVHRDIKPGNVKITPGGQIFLVDFGLAKLSEEDQNTTTGARAMTPGYSPPEQYGTAHTDHRSDIYSLGATLYAATTGTIPEDGLARLMGQVELTNVQKRNSKISHRFAQAIEKALETKPEDRYKTAKDFKKALLEARKETPKPGLPVVESKAEKDIEQKKDLSGGLVSSNIGIGKQPNGISEGFRIASLRKKNGWMWSALGIGVIAILAAIVIWSARAGVPSNSTNDLVTKTASSLGILASMPVVSESATSTNLPTIPATLNVTSTPRQLPVIINPSVSTPTPIGGTSRIAFTSDRSGSVQIWEVYLDGTGLHQITDIPEGACQPDWSPDGTKLIFTSPCDGNNETYPGAGLFITNVDGTNLVPLPSVSGGDFDPAWSPDGKTIAFTSLRITKSPRIYLMKLEDNSVVRLSGKYSRDMQPAWSKDGKKIAYVSKQLGPTDIWIMNPDGSDPTSFTHSGFLLDHSPVWSPSGNVIVFTQLEEAGGVPHLATATRTEGSINEYRFDLGPIPVREADYSPDGLWLVFESWPSGSNHDIYMISANGAGRTRITDYPSTEFDVDWYPIP